MYSSRDSHSATSRKINRDRLDPISSLAVSPNYLDCDFDFGDLCNEILDELEAKQ